MRANGILGIMGVLECSGRGAAYSVESQATTDVIEQRTLFPSAGRPPLSLEGMLARPASDMTMRGDQTPRATALLCHPQPATSSMDDPLTMAMARTLAAAGLITLRFNFRGVGASVGQQTDGRLEPLDIAGAIEFLLTQPGANREKLCLIGHAFGAHMALTYAAHDPRVKMVVAVSPPIFRVTPELGQFAQPKLFITGEYDEVSPRHKLEPWIERLPSRALRIVLGARHLMRGYEAPTTEVVVKYVTRWAQTPGV